MRGTNKTVVEKFMAGIDNYRNENNSLRSENSMLYSYNDIIGYQRVGDNFLGRAQWILLDGDIPPTVTSKKHQSITFSYAEDEARVSFLALRRAEINPKTCVLIDLKKDTYYSTSVESIMREDKVTEEEALKKFNEEMKLYKRKWGVLYFSQSVVNSAYKQFTYHEIGTVLLFSPENSSLWICSMDEDTYFISKLPYWCNTIQEAFNSLKPLEVKEAERDGKEVKRQGEWFFIPCESVISPVTKYPLSPMSKVKNKSGELLIQRKANLPEKDSKGSNVHQVTAKYGEYVTGLVRHYRKEVDRKSRLSGEHSILKLKGWYKAVLNKSLEDYSSEGRVD